MTMVKVNPIVQWWMTPKLPVQHIYISEKDRPQGLVLNLKLYFRKWVIHPLKRRAAKYYLAILRKFTGITVVAVTGSAGKTTTKEMIAAILKLQGETIYSKDNIDPIYNIPSTILCCRPSTKYLVLEMGVEYPGEMDFYLWLASPDIGVITNVFPTHIEYFGDSGGVFREKSKLINSLSSKSLAVLNFDDKLLRKLKGKIKSKTVWFGRGSAISSSLEKTTDDYKTRFLITFDDVSGENIEITLPIMGVQFISNALAASAVSKALEIPLAQIKEGLETFDLPSHRMRIVKHKSGAIILDDSYNNNPMAAMESIKTFNEFALGKEKVVVFGDMLELGESEERYHKELGEFLAKINLTKLICVGNASRFTASAVMKMNKTVEVAFVVDVFKAIDELKPYLKDGVVILVKGSRSINLDKLVEKL